MAMKGANGAREFFLEVELVYNSVARFVNVQPFFQRLMHY